MTHHPPPPRPSLAVMRARFAEVRRLNQIDPHGRLVLRGARWEQKGKGSK